MRRTNTNNRNRKRSASRRTGWAAARRPLGLSTPGARVGDERRVAGGAPRRVFVISDAHGYPELIANALEHGGFRPGADAFVYAGDLVDRGPDPEGCLELVETYATEVLVGNHELAVLEGFDLFEQTSESRRLRRVFLDRVLSSDRATAWKAVTCVDGVLISHAGIARHYAPAFHRDCLGRPELLADLLNREFLQAVRRELECGDWDDDGILGDRGPLWFRPDGWAGAGPLPGVTQVVGHSPPVPALEADGFFMVDPCVFRGRGDPLRYRYAVIEAGRVRVEEGMLPTDASVRSAESPGRPLPARGGVGCDVGMEGTDGL